MGWIRPALQIADDHSLILDYWRQIGIKDATIIHFDMHHDLFNNAESKVDCGNFFWFGAIEGLIQHIYWIVPVPRSFLSGNYAHSVLNTLPPTIYSGLKQKKSGRWCANTDFFYLEIRAYDDLPKAYGNRELHVSYDLDFFYHREFHGPIINPVDWVNKLNTYFVQQCPASIFVALSLHDGYSPPTYRAVVDWFVNCIETGLVPEWSNTLWSYVHYYESMRLRDTPIDLELDVPQKLPDEILQFFDIFKCYLSEDFPKAFKNMSILPIILQFNPMDELKVEHRHEKEPHALIINRVRKAMKHYNA